MILAIARRELLSLFVTPLAWVLLAGCQFLLAYVFLVHLQDYLVLLPRLRLAAQPVGLSEYLYPRLFSSVATIFMLALPLLSMRVLAAEYSQQSYALLQSAPVSSFQIVLGKYLALVLFAALGVVLTGLMPLSLALFSAFELAAWLLALLGAWCFLLPVCAIGLFFSSLTRMPSVAAFATLAVLLLLWVIGPSAETRAVGGALTRYLEMPSHLHSFLAGNLNSVDLAYYLLLSGLFLLVTVRRLDNQRLQP